MTSSENQHIFQIGKILKSPQSPFNEYYITGYLAKGSYGEVYEATSGNQVYAIKVFNFKKEGSQENMQAEINAYGIVSHDPLCQDYIVCMYEAFRGSKYTGVIILEYMRGGDLSSYITNRGNRHSGVPLYNLVFLMRDLLAGLAFIHSKGLAHRDIKPGNVMANSDHKIFKIGDMGASCGSSLMRCTSFATFPWLSPELARDVKNSQYTCVKSISVNKAQKGDIWAMGMIFWEMAFGEDKFPINNTGYNSRGQYNNKNIVDNIANITRQGQVETPNYLKKISHMPSSTINFILTWMLQVDPRKRKSAQILLQFLEDEIKGCLSGNEIYSRSNILNKTINDPQLHQFLINNKYDHSVSLSGLCNLYNKFLYKSSGKRTRKPSKPFKKRTRKPTKPLKKPTRKRTRKLFKEPSSKSVRDRQKFQDIFPPPKVDTEEISEPMVCIINLKNRKLHELRVMAESLGIPVEGVSKSELCRIVYTFLLQMKRIQSGMVARDIYEGIKFAAKDDLIAGIKHTYSPNKGKMAIEQILLIRAILGVAKSADSGDIDIRYLEARRDGIVREIRYLFAKKGLSRAEKSQLALRYRIYWYLQQIIPLIGISKPAEDDGDVKFREPKIITKKECDDIMCLLGITDRAGIRQWRLDNHPDRHPEKAEDWDKYQPNIDKCKEKNWYCEE